MPNPPPITPEWNAALNAIIEQANLTLTLLPSCDACAPQPPPIFQSIAAQTSLTKSLATALMSSGDIP